VQLSTIGLSGCLVARDNETDVLKRKGKPTHPEYLDLRNWQTAWPNLGLWWGVAYARFTAYASIRRSGSLFWRAKDSRDAGD
jgi:hypothetical protein